MATVYKAYDTRLERDVAIKVIRREVISEAMMERILKRFERKAKALAQLDHPNIVPIFDYGEHGGAPYLVMQYVAGGTLKQQMEGKTEIPLTLPLEPIKAARLLLPIAHALAHAHEK
jgi:serine/threonine protein kinase